MAIAGHDGKFAELEQCDNVGPAVAGHIRDGNGNDSIRSLEHRREGHAAVREEIPSLIVQENLNSQHVGRHGYDVSETVGIEIKEGNWNLRAGFITHRVEPVPANGGRAIAMNHVDVGA